LTIPRNSPAILLTLASKPNSNLARVGVPAAGRLLISSYISRRQHPNGSLPETTENMNDPREVAASGGRDHHDGMSVWRL
jgi:hypothetical protein